MGDVDVLRGCAREAYAVLLDNIPAFTRRAAVPFVLLLPIQLIDYMRQESGFSDPLGIALGLGLLALACHTSFMVSWHRFVLLGPRASDTGIRFGRRELRFLVTSLAPLALAGVLLLPLGIAIYPLHAGGTVSDGVIGPAFTIIFVGLLVWSFSRFLPAFPSLAVDRALGLRHAWRMTKSHQGTIVLIVLCALSPAMLMEALLAALAGAMLDVLGVAVLVLATAIGFVGDAVGIGAASLIYARLAPAALAEPFAESG
ncbi:MAG: hypothetical protein FJX35_21145 [Alphaproteobacteria bacterium]|nr:hypothetical protein [Alphaproteobacteria bacterium]